METTKSVSQVIHAIKESLQHPPTQRRLIALREQPLSAKQQEWSRRWIGVRSFGEPQLERAERTVVAAARLMSKSPHAGALIVFFGRNGTGKTHCARALVNWAKTTFGECRYVPQANVVRMPAAAFYRWPGLLDRMKSGEWDIAHDLSPPSSFPGFLEGYELLALDDIGAEHDPTSVGRDKLCQILSAREKSWTVVTTNILPSSWGQVFEHRIESRLFRNAVHVDLSNVTDYASRV